MVVTSVEPTEVDCLTQAGQSAPPLSHLILAMVRQLAWLQRHLGTNLGVFTGLDGLFPTMAIGNGKR